VIPGEPTRGRIAITEVRGDGSIDPLAGAVRVGAPIAHLPEVPLIELPPRLDPRSQLTGQKAADMLVDLDSRDPPPAIWTHHSPEVSLRDQGPDGVLTDAEQLGRLAIGQEERRDGPSIMGRVEIRAEHVAERRAQLAVISIVRVVAGYHLLRVHSIECSRSAASIASMRPGRLYVVRPSDAELRTRVDFQRLTPSQMWSVAPRVDRVDSAG
jgi:hypothetical protein